MADGTVAFEFASKKTGKPAASIATFTINGEEFHIRALKDASVAYLSHKMKSGRPDVVISAVLDFTEKALLPESAERFEALVLDVDDGLELAQIVKVFEHILGVVATFPTGSSTASSAPPRKNGSPSRATSRSRGVPAL